MAIEIINNGASLKIRTGITERNIMKSHIREIVVVKNNMVKIDIGRGALYNVFIPHAEVTAPVTSSPEALKDAINDMLSLNQGMDNQSQSEEISKLNQLNETVSSIRNSVNSLDSKVFFEPALIDESNPNIIYKGFASPGAKMEEAVWAIQKISYTDDVCTYQWANGNKNFANIWNNRTALVYA